MAKSTAEFGVSEFGVRAHLDQNSGSEHFFWKKLRCNAGVEDLPARLLMQTSFALQAIWANRVCHPGLQRKIALTPNFPENVL
jgi:hypothetical protein